MSVPPPLLLIAAASTEREGLTEMLERRGHAVTHVEDGMQGRTILEGQPEAGLVAGDADAEVGGGLVGLEHGRGGRGAAARDPARTAEEDECRALVHLPPEFRAARSGPFSSRALTSVGVP